METRYEVKDICMADEGERLLREMELRMPVLHLINLRFKNSRVFEGLKIAVCLHLTSESAAFILALRNGGAEVYAAPSNPMTINDATAAALAVNHGVHIFADSSSADKFEENITRVLSVKPDIIADDGATMISAAYKKYDEYCCNLIGSTEQTTAGVAVNNTLEKGGYLRHPVIGVNSSKSKHMFDNRYGVGQTFIETCSKLTNSVLGGKNVVICGYGYCGSGAAMMAKGLGANVIVTEIDPFKVMDAHMHGFSVMPIREAAKTGDIFSTFTGSTKVIDYDSMCLMKNGAILMNCGSGTTEVDVATLKSNAVSVFNKNEDVDVYTLPNGRNIQIACNGRVANITAVGGNPAEVMDMSFGIHAMALEYLVENHSRIGRHVVSVPNETDEAIIKLKLLTYGIDYDIQTEEQKKYSSEFI